MISVETVRDINNRYPHLVNRQKLVCPRGCGEFTADLARYWVPRDKQTFLCPECDSEPWLQFSKAATSSLPLAQRTA
jgi:transposase-like protein